MRNENDNSTYPEPFVIKPRREHKQSLVLLHGRGSNGQKFGTEFVTSKTTLDLPSTAGGSDLAVFARMFPNARFIFPTARKRRAKWYNRATINQWFDNVPIDEQDKGTSKEEEEWQLEGLRESRVYLKSVVDEEVSLVGAANVFIGGLSQGCAMSLHLLLSYEESAPLGGFVGMSGWLPFADDIEAIIHPTSLDGGRQNENDDEDDNPFATSGDEELGLGDERSNQCRTGIDSLSAATRICNFVRDNMDLPPIFPSSQPSWLSTPVFLGHGIRDERVKVTRGLRAANFLRDIGVGVTWNEYDEGHWYKVPEEIDDIVKFLQTCLLRPQI